MGNQIALHPESHHRAHPLKMASKVESVLVCGTFLCKEGQSGWTNDFNWPTTAIFIHIFYL
jgi:hypothetical protein